jgi:murein DD-endopeptidase MepM/ murein hydrolase activator NlpD
MKYLRFARRMEIWLLFVGVIFAFQLGIHTQTFLFPTDNHSLLNPGSEIEFYVGPSGRDWDGGQYGCVRNEGWRMHEGLDIRCLYRSKSNEPIDEVRATLAGKVGYVNRNAGLSNYGKYIVLEHIIEGLPTYSLYAHLKEIASGVTLNKPIQAGEPIGVMGRTANISPPIQKPQAHLHFEIGFMVSPYFIPWHKETFNGQRNDHGAFHGANLSGFDPSRIFLKQNEQAPQFSFLDFVRNQEALFRVRLRSDGLSLMQRYVRLVKRSKAAEKEGFAGFEIAFTYGGTPFELTPLAASELTGLGEVTLHEVNEALYEAQHCRKLVTKSSGTWVLTAAGRRLIDLITYR